MNNKDVVHSAWHLVGRLFVVTFILLPWGNNKAGTTENWSQEPFYEMKTAETAPFTLVSISSIDDHLIGNCGYIDLKGRSPTRINGSQTPDGDFWPNVIYEVGNDFRGKYKAIGKSSRKGRPLTLYIKPKDTNTILHVDLDLFRAMIGKYKFGRIVLENGEPTTFALKFLLPPEKIE